MSIRTGRIFCGSRRISDGLGPCLVLMRVWLLMLLLMLTGLLTGCGRGTEESAAAVEQMERISQLNGKRIGIVVGTSYDETIGKRFPQAELVYMASFPDAIVALQNGKIDCYITDELTAGDQAGAFPELTWIPQHLTEDEYAFVIKPGNLELQEKINGALAELKTEGQFERLQKTWMEGKGEQVLAEDPDADTSNGTLHVITCSDLWPFSYLKDNQLVGYDIEMIQLVAEKLGYGLEIETGDFAALIPSVLSGKADVAVGCITVTQERAETVLFTDMDYESGSVAVVLSAQEEAAAEGRTLSGGFWRTFIAEKRWKLILDGLIVTVVVSLVSVMAGTLAGVPAGLLLLSKNRTIRRTAQAVSLFLERMPQVVILVVLYYALLSPLGLSPILVGILAFTLDFANTVAGFLSAGVHAVDPGELEAAKALGYSPVQTYRKIVFPQVIFRMFSQYEAAVISLVKGTSIIGYIAVGDLTKAGDIVRNSTYDAFFPLLVTAAIYFVFTKLLIAWMKRVAVRLDPKYRPRKVFGVRQ